MVNRLTKIYTRTGDDGTTGLGDGGRVDKDALRIEVIGDIDELNSLIGLLVAEAPANTMTELLTDIQHALFDAGGELSMPGHVMLTEEYTKQLEQAIDHYNSQLPGLKEFILPGGGQAAAICHLARAVCRRAERHLVGLARTENVNLQSRRFLNRLSDLLFVLARTLAHDHGNGEVFWDKARLDR